MSIEETIQFLVDVAATQEARLAKLEQNRALLEQAIRRLSERQQLLELWASAVEGEHEEAEQLPLYRPRKPRNADNPTPNRNCRPRR